MSMWEVEYTHEFGEWYESLSELQQDAVISRAEVLESAGPGLGRPTVDNVHQSRHSNMKELRCERAIRVMFAFDQRRAAILMIGGDKSPDDPGSPNWNRWYDHYTPFADGLYDAHLEELRQEGLI